MSPAPAPGEALRDARRLGRRFLAGGLLAGVLVFAAAAVHREWDRGEDIELWRKVAESEVRALAVSIRRSMSATDAQLRAVQDRLHALAPSGEAHFDAIVSTRAFHDFLREIQPLAGGASVVLSVADAQGRVVNFSHAFPARARNGGRIDVAEAAFFRQLRDDPSAALALGTPIPSQREGGPRFHLARPLRSAEGRLLGVVFAGFDSEAMSASLGTFAMEGKKLRLFHENGTVLARWPVEPAYAIGRALPGSLPIRLHQSGQVSGVFRAGEQGADPSNANELRVLASLRAGDFPIVASVRYGESLVLAHTLREAAATWTLATLVACLLAAMGWAVRALLLRRAQAIEALLEADKRLRHQEAESRKLALIARRTDNAVLLTDREGRTVWVNDGFTRVTGYAFDEIVGRTPGSVLQGPATDPHARQRIAQRLRAGEGFKEELINYGRDGRPYWLAVEVQPTFAEGGGIDGFMAIERDITVEKLALRNLRVQHAVSEQLVRSASLEEALPALLRTLGEYGDWRAVQAWALGGGHLHWRAAWQSSSQGAGNFVEASRTCLLQRGQGAPGRAWERAAVTPQPDHDSDASDPRAAAAAADALGDGFCVPVVCGGQVEGVLEFSGRRLRIDDPRAQDTAQAVANLLGQFIVRRRAERAQRDALQAAERATLAKGRFIATVSHEIRTPLNAVVGMISLMDEAGLPEALRMELGVVREASAQLMAVVNDVLDLSRLESGRAQPNRGVFRPRSLLEQAARIGRGLPGAQVLEVRQEADEGVPEWVEGDEPRLFQVLLNLVGNAVKFTAKGSVTIRLACVRGPGAAPALVFDVRDTGKGIPAEHLERIFEPFEQSHAGAEARGPGTGLGLTISRKIAQLLGGTLTVESVVGEGSTFRLEVPCAEAAAPAATPGDVPGRSASGALRRLRILLAEDTPASQLVARLILERLGHEVTAVDDGEQALASFSREDYDAVFLDVQMPRMNGIDAARAMRALGVKGARLPIIGLSAFTQDADRISALAGGMSHYIPKPVRLEDVDRLLREIFSGQAAAPGA